MDLFYMLPFWFFFNYEFNFIYVFVLAEQPACLSKSPQMLLSVRIRMKPKGASLLRLCCPWIKDCFV